MKYWLLVRLIILMSLLSFIALRCNLDRRFLYFPNTWQENDWANLWDLPLEDVWFQAEDGTQLHGWFVGAKNSKAVLLWCHGNAGNITDRLENVKQLHDRGFTVFIFDYRGYGRSSGAPSEIGLYQDAAAAYTELVSRRKIPREELIIFGRSLGAAVAGHLATQVDAAGLILETPFSSIKDMAGHYYANLPVYLLLKARYPLVDYVNDIDMPLMVVHGDQDHIVPFKLGRRVFDAGNEPKTFYAITGADHNDTYIVGSESYFQRLGKFIEQSIALGESDNAQ